LASHEFPRKSARAPPDVRQWMNGSDCFVGLQPGQAGRDKPNANHLACAMAEEVFSWFAVTAADPNVFLPRSMCSLNSGDPGLGYCAIGRVEAFRTDRNRSSQPGACKNCRAGQSHAVNIINQALGRVRRRPHASFAGFEPWTGPLLLHWRSQQNILRIWQSVIANSNLQPRRQQDLPQ